VWVLGFSVVASCELVKTECYKCDLDDDASCDTTYPGLTQEQCFNGVDGFTIMMAEYKIDTERCLYRRCFDSRLIYHSNRIIAFMTCSAGIRLIQYMTKHTYLINYILCWNKMLSFLDNKNIINWRDVQIKNVVNNVDMPSLRAPWQNDPYKN